jgi:hypothetical protein
MEQSDSSNLEVFTSLDRILRNLNVTEQEYNESIVIYTANRQKDFILGPLYSEHVEFIEFQNGKLKANSTHSGYLQNLNFEKTKILDRLRQKVKNVKINEIEFRLGKVKKTIRKETKKQGSLEGKEDLIQFLETIDDPKEKDSLKRLLSFL